MTRLSWKNQALYREHGRCVWYLGIASGRGIDLLQKRIANLEREMVCRGMRVPVAGGMRGMQEWKPHPLDE